MGAYQVVFTPYASGDLEQIVRYIARDNPRCVAAVRGQAGGPRPEPQ